MALSILGPKIPCVRLPLTIVKHSHISSMSSITRRGLLTSFRSNCFANSREGHPGVASRNYVSQSSQKPAGTTSTPNDSKILDQQRLQRPLSPHLSIYRWQITSVASTLMRITGVVMGGSLYLFGAAYLISPYLGWDLSSTAIATAFASLPWTVKAGLKTLVALPLTFHGINALRFLSWDMTIGVNNKTVSRTGWTLVVASITSALILGFVV